jgi:hypothetical protein
MTTINLEVKKIGRSFCVVSGAAVLGKFSTEAAAIASSVADAALYAFWAGSAGSSVQNTPASVVQL